MSAKEGSSHAAVEEPLDLIRLSLGILSLSLSLHIAILLIPPKDQRIFVKMRGERELRGHLHVSVLFFNFSIF